MTRALGADMDDKEALARARERYGSVIADNYVLDQVLGIGGMGVVFLATQKSLRRTVALKLPRPELAEDHHVHRMFRNEAFAGSRLSHRNAVAIYDFGRERGVPYLVMEHIPGPRLGEVLAERGPLPCDTALGIVRPLVAALEEIHANGIVHADVKCDNVIVQTLRDGSIVPRLIDFGIARFVDEVIAPPPEAERFVTGTPEYVAPEVARGELPTFAADVYAVGVMLYELVTNATPFGLDTATAIMSRKLEREVIPIAERYPELGLPSELDALITRSLSRDPMHRPDGARMLAKWLDGVAGVSSSGVPGGAFSTEANTERVSIHAIIGASVAERRLDVFDAIKSGERDRVVRAYLGLADALVDRQLFAAAQSELEEGVELVSTPDGTGPGWRLLLALSGIYEKRGDHVKARIAARAARDNAGRTSAPACRERDGRYL